ncbi:MAG: WYL domain-containing protein [Verrucomicrobiae bacterium]|nr:WYL domain-containing protein [Verrucomicrobiae bacterium]
MDAVIGKIAEAAPARIEPDIWSILAEAVARCLVIAARYRRFDGTERDYLIEPLRLVAHRANWYALARKRPGRELRAFALSRFGSAKPTGETFVPPKGFDWREAAKDAFGIGFGIKPANIRILFSNTVATAISERVWHPTQKIWKRRDGGLELRIRAAPTIDLVRWILSWTPDVRVLAPKALRARVQRHLQPDRRSRL